LVDIIIIDKSVRCSKYNELSIPILLRGSIYWLRAVPRPEISSGFMFEALPGITGFYTWKYSSLLVKEYQGIRILFELSTKLLPNR
jgi:hypothetical protein